MSTLTDHDHAFSPAAPEPTTPGSSRTVHVAAIGDLHFGRTSQGSLHPVLTRVTAGADVLLICGDLTDYGTPEEARGLARELTSVVKIPIVSVLGNHDYESGRPEEVRDILREAGVTVLDGDTCEVEGIGFAGVKGFCGGFGRHALAPWGEPSLKAFVQEAIAEALKLEAALARLRTEHRIALLHYAPIEATVIGEPPPIFPYLGSSRLEEPLSRFNVSAVFHGHAHHGTLEGRTTSGATVYNVSLPLLLHEFPDNPARRLEFIVRS